MSAHLSSSDDTIRFIRTAGLLCIVGALIATIGGAVTGSLPSSVPATDLSYPYTPSVFRFAQILWAIAYVLMFVGTLGLVRSGAAGTSWLARVGLGMTLLGLAVVIVCNVAFSFFATGTDTDAPVVMLDTIIGMGSMLTALAFVLVGIAVLRTGRWQGWQRFMPLLCGLFVFVVLMPILMLQPDLVHWAVAGWSVCFVFLGIAIYQHPALPSTEIVAVERDNSRVVAHQSP